MKPDCAGKGNLFIGNGRQNNLPGATGRGHSDTVSTNYVRGIREYLIQRNVDVPGFLSDFGLVIDSLEDPGNRIPIATYQVMLERAGELARDSDAGLHIGECIKPAQYGVLGLSIMSCENVGEIFERHQRYEQLVSNHATSVYHFEDDETRLVRDSGNLAIGREIAEENAASMVTYLRWITGQDLGVTRVSFTHAQPSDLSEHRRIFKGKIMFDQPQVELVFPAHYQNLSIVQHDPTMRRMMDALAEKQLKELSHSDGLLGSVRSLIAEKLDSGGVNLDAVADQLAITPRTLQRRLSDQGKTFKSLLDEVRHNLALTYITQPFIDIAELAYLLGFSDQTAFQRAFKKWTGTTPGKYMRQGENRPD